VPPDPDPHAAFREDVAERNRLDPMPAFEGLSQLTGVAVDDLVRYALVRWASEGAESLLWAGPTALRRLLDVVEAAEAQGTDAARLAAWPTVRGRLAWLLSGAESLDRSGGGEDDGPDGCTRSPGVTRSGEGGSAPTA